VCKENGSRGWKGVPKEWGDRRILEVGSHSNLVEKQSRKTEKKKTKKKITQSDKRDCASKDAKTRGVKKKKKRTDLVSHGPQEQKKNNTY